MRSSIPWRLIVVGLIAYSVFGWATLRMDAQPRHYREEGLSVQPSIPLQVYMALGDRYLAASFGAFRAISIGGGHLDATSAKVMGQIQRDVGFLNPWHEDNYYTAAAVLPWEDQLEAAQYVLRQATDARKQDLLPPFYYGFNLQQFEGDFVGAAKAATIAASRTSRIGEQNALLDIAAKWGEREATPDLAIKAIEAVQAQSKDAGLIGYLEGRKQRVKNLYRLRQLAQQYEKMHGKPLARVDELISSGMIDRIPEDPLAPGGYVLNKGVIVPRIYLPGGQS